MLLVEMVFGDDTVPFRRSPLQLSGDPIQDCSEAILQTLAMLPVNVLGWRILALRDLAVLVADSSRKNKRALNQIMPSSFVWRSK